MVFYEVERRASDRRRFARGPSSPPGVISRVARVRTTFISVRANFGRMNYGQLRDRLADVAFTTAVPFDEKGGSIDHEALRENLEALYDAGARVFVANGNTGEYYALTHSERVEIVRTHVEAVGDGATVVGGVGGSTGTAVQLAREYEELGAECVMVMHPDHTYAHERGLVEYYDRIAEATDLGVVIYKRDHDVSRRIVTELSERENVVAVKYAVNDIKDFSQTVSDASDEMTFINGIAERFAPAFAVEGAEGFTTGIGNFVPGPVLALRDAIEAGDLERAREIRDLLRPYEDLREETGEGNALVAANNVPAVKYAMDLAGFVGGPVREPLVDLSEADKERAERYYERISDADL